MDKYIQYDHAEIKEYTTHALSKYAYNKDGNTLQRGYNQGGGLHGQHREGLGMLVG